MKEKKYTKEERGPLQRNFHSAAIFVPVTPNETGNATVAYFSGDLNNENLEKVSLNDISSNSCRIKNRRKGPCCV